MVNVSLGKLAFRYELPCRTEDVIGGNTELRLQMKPGEQAYLCVDLVLVRRLSIAYDNEQVAQNSTLC